MSLHSAQLETTPASHFANRLLAALPSHDYQRLLPDLVYRPIAPRQVLQRGGAQVDDVLFPERGVCSVIHSMNDGASIEVAMIGIEGMIGFAALFGDWFPFGDVIARTSGAVHALGVDVFRREMDRRGSFHAIVTQYCQSLMALAAQSSACNGLHSAYQRCCRWLLASSARLQNDEMPVTHEMLAMMLGVRRPTVTLTLQQLATAGLIWQNRGKIRIVNRPGLEGAACECHALDKRLTG